MELTYTEVDGYFYPDLTLPETEDHRPLGKYGLLRKTYLKRYRPMMYDRLLLAGKLDVHLRKIDALAAEQVDRVIADLAAKEGVDEQLKATDQLRWVGQMNSFKAAAEEQVLRNCVRIISRFHTFFSRLGKDPQRLCRCFCKHRIFVQKRTCQGIPLKPQCIATGKR